MANPFKNTLAALPSHLKPTPHSNGDENAAFQLKHHGKSQSHVVSKRTSQVVKGLSSLPIYMVTMETVFICLSPRRCLDPTVVLCSQANVDGALKLRAATPSALLRWLSRRFPGRTFPSTLNFRNLAFSSCESNQAIVSSG